MHQYLESVRSEIETAAGQESYLAAGLFMRVHNSIAYEDDGENIITSKEQFEEVQNRVINALHLREDLDLDAEILAWQGAVLRDIGRDFYIWWSDYKDQKFRAPDCFSDGESCIALEAACEKAGGNPTEDFTAVLEIEQLLTKICTSPNTTISELASFWEFKAENLNKASDNPFVQKRVVAESKRSVFAHIIDEIRTVSSLLETRAKALAGKYHLLYITPFQMLESLATSLDAFLNYEVQEDTEQALLLWVDKLFPKAIAGGVPNPIYQSPLQHKIVGNLMQATQCMVQHVVYKKPSFEQRDQIMVPFIKTALEQVKMYSLHNLHAQKSAEADLASQSL